MEDKKKCVISILNTKAKTGANIVQINKAFLELVGEKLAETKAEAIEFLSTMAEVYLDGNGLYHSCSNKSNHISKLVEGQHTHNSPRYLSNRSNHSNRSFGNASFYNRPITSYRSEYVDVNIPQNIKPAVPGKIGPQRRMTYGASLKRSRSPEPVKHRHCLTPERNVMPTRRDKSRSPKRSSNERSSSYERSKRELRHSPTPKRLRRSISPRWSPVRDRRSRSPVREKRSWSPKDRRSRSPPKDRSRSPRNRRSRSPRNRRSHSPRNRRSRSPRNRRSRSPRNRRDRSPKDPRTRDRRSRSAERENRPLRSSPSNKRSTTQRSENEVPPTRKTTWNILTTNVTAINSNINAAITDSIQPNQIKPKKFKFSVIGDGCIYYTINDMQNNAKSKMPLCNHTLTISDALQMVLQQKETLQSKRRKVLISIGATDLRMHTQLSEMRRDFTALFLLCDEYKLKPLITTVLCYDSPELKAKADIFNQFLTECFEYVIDIRDVLQSGLAEVMSKLNKKNEIEMNRYSMGLGTRQQLILNVQKE